MISYVCLRAQHECTPVNAGFATARTAGNNFGFRALGLSGCCVFRLSYLRARGFEFLFLQVPDDLLRPGERNHTTRSRTVIYLNWLHVLTSICIYIYIYIYLYIYIFIYNIGYVYTCTHISRGRYTCTAIEQRYSGVGVGALAIFAGLLGSSRL